MAISYDLAPAAEQVARLADGVRDDQLARPTPCEDWPVDVLLGHLLELTSAFTAAASKIPTSGSPETSGNLPDDWRTQLRDRLRALVAAWRAPEAWQGETEAGGIVMPGEVTGVVALDELVLHGWDLARATGQPFSPDPASVRASLGFAASMSEPGQEESREGLYGPVVPVPNDAPDLDRLLGFAGRDPRWTPARTVEQP